MKKLIPILFCIFLLSLVSVSATVTYVGNCNTQCNITAQTYNATLAGGAITSLRWNNDYITEWTQNNTALNSGTNHINIVSNASGTVMNDASSTYSTTVTGNNSNQLKVFVPSDQGANLTYYFNNTYFFVDITANRSMRIADYFVNGSTIPATISNNYISNTTNSQAVGGITDSDASDGLVAFWLNQSVSNYTLVIYWNQSITTDFDYRFQSTTTVPFLQQARSSEISAGVVFRKFYKVLPKNLSQSIEQNRIKDVMNAFKNNYEYNDTPVSSSTYYVDCVSGSDSNSGTSSGSPYKTIDKINTLTYNSGDIVLFKRGVICRGRVTLKNNQQIADYGTGNKPELWNSYNLSSTSNWTVSYGNVYKSSNTFPDDVGNIALNIATTETYGFKKNMSQLASSQGQYYYNTSDSKVYFYSTSNPATYYPNGIEAMWDADIIDNSDNPVSNTRISNLTLRYAGAHGIGLRDVINQLVSNVSAYVIGGSFLDSGKYARYGNAFEWGLNSSNVTGQYLYAQYVFDACYTHQAWTTGGNATINNVELKNSICTDSAEAYEYFNSRVTGASNSSNVSIHHNTFVNLNSDWHGNGRPDILDSTTFSYQSCARLARSPPGSRNFTFYDNICAYPTNYTTEVGDGLSSNWQNSQINLDYNLYYQINSPAYFSRFLGTRYTNLTNHQAGTNNDTNSFFGDPKFVDYASDNFQPYADSPACAMSSTGSYVGALPCSSSSSPTTYGLILLNGTTAGYSQNVYSNNFDSGIDWSVDIDTNGDVDWAGSPGMKVEAYAASGQSIERVYYTINNASLISNISFITNITSTFNNQMYFAISDNNTRTKYLYLQFSDGSYDVTCGNETSSTITGTWSFSSRIKWDITINNTGDGRVRVYKDGVDQGGSCYSSANIGIANQVAIFVGSEFGKIYFDNMSIYTTTIYNPLLNYTSETNDDGDIILSGQSFIIHPIVYSTGLIGGTANITINVYNSVGTLVLTSTSEQSSNYSYTVSGFSSGSYYYNATMFNGTHYGISTTRSLIISTLNINGINTPYSGQQVSTSSLNISWNTTTTNVSFSNLTHYNITLLNSSGGVNQTINSNVSTNLSYVWNIANAGLNTGTYYIKVYSYDNLGNSVSDLVKFYYLKPIYSYTNPALETSSNIVIINFSTNDLDFNISTFYGNFSINGVNYTLSSSNDSVSFAGISNATMPNITSTTTFNITWNITINGQNHLFNNTITVTSLTSVIFSNTTCSAGLSTGFFFDSKNEETKTAIPVNISYNFYIGVANQAYEQSYGNISNTYSFSVCINSTQAPTWTVGYGEIQYESSGYTDRRYYIFNNTRITSTTTNITLYSLLSSVQTSFQITVQSKISSTPYQNKYVALLRWYPELNSYLVVDMGLTDNTGSTVIHSVVEDVDYRFAIYELDGTLIALKDPIRMVCLTTPCAYTITIDNEDTDFDNLINLQISLDYNTTTGLWTLIYNDPSQATTDINLTIFKDQGDSSFEICNSHLASYTGVVTCSTPVYTNAKLRGVVSRSASPEIPIYQKIVDLSDSALRSSFGLFISLIIIVPVAFLMALLSPVFAVVGIVIATMIAYTLGSINYLIITGFAVLGGIVLHFMGKVNR